MELIQDYCSTDSEGGGDRDGGHGANGGTNVGDGGEDAGNGVGEANDTTTAHSVGGVDGGDGGIDMGSAFNPYSAAPQVTATNDSCAA